MRRLLLRLRDGLCAAGYAAPVDRARQLVMAAGEAVAEVQGSHVRARMQVGCAPRVVVPVDGGHDAADAALAAAQVLPQPYDAVIRRRFDRHASRADLMAGHGIERADRQAARQAAGELRGAEDRRKRRRRGVGVDSGQFGCASDAS